MHRGPYVPHTFKFRTTNERVMVHTILSPVTVDGRCLHEFPAIGFIGVCVPPVYVVSMYCISSGATKHNGENERVSIFVVEKLMLLHVTTSYKRRVSVIKRVKMPNRLNSSYCEQRFLFLCVSSKGRVREKSLSTLFGGSLKKEEENSNNNPMRRLKGPGRH